MSDEPPFVLNTHGSRHAIDEETRIFARHAEGEERDELIALADGLEAALVAGGGEVPVALLTWGLFRRVALIERAEVHKLMDQLGILDEAEPYDWEGGA